MAEAGQVVQGPAARRGELGRCRVDQVQGHDVLGDALQLFVDRGPLHVGLVPAHGAEQFVDRAGVDPAGEGVHGHLGAGRNPLQGGIGTDDGRHPEFAGQRRHVAADAAGLDDDAAAAAHHHHVFRRGVTGNEHPALGEAGQILDRLHMEGRPAAHALGGDLAAVEQQRVAGERRRLEQVEIFRALDLERPRLEDEQGAVRGQGPLHVLRALVMALQGGAVAGQAADLGVVEAGRPLLRFGHGPLLDPAPVVEHQLHRLAGHVFFEDREGFVLADRVGVRRDHAVHRVGAEPPDGVDEDVLVGDVVGVAGVEHAAGPGVDHLQAGHGHGQILVDHALAAPVGDGAGRVEAGDDRFVGLGDLGPGHAEQGQVLAGKAEVAVLAHGAAAQGEQHRLVRAPQGLGGGEDLGLQRRRHGPGLDQFDHLRAQAVEQVVLVDVDEVLLADDLVLQAVLVEKGVEPAGGDGEPGRHRDAQPVADLAQVGVLAAGPVGVLEREFAVGHDGAGRMVDLLLVDHLLDAAVDLLQGRVQLPILGPGHDVEALDHLEGVLERFVDLVVDGGEAEHLFALELLVQVGEHGQEFGVGDQQFLEQGVAEAEEGIHFRPVAGRRGAATMAELVEELFEIVENGRHDGHLQGLSCAAGSAGGSRSVRDRRLADPVAAGTARRGSQLPLPTVRLLFVRRT